MLLDRLPERAALGRLLEAARGGHSGVLVVRGEAGVGKTTLLEGVIAAAAGLRIVRVAGAESEMELAFAALLITEGYPAGAPIVKRAVSAFRGADVTTEGLGGS